jgi:hypothetical protein
LDQSVLRVYRALRVCLESKVHLAHKVLLALREHKVFLEKQAHRAQLVQ